MKQMSIISITVFAICLLAVGSGAEDDPKRVMNFISVMDLDCGGAIDEESCTALTDILIEELVNIGKYTVIDRANRDKILSEQGFQQTGCVDSSCSVEAGRMLGVGKIVVGSIKKVGGTYIVSLQLINVQTAALELAKSESCKCDLDGLINTVRKAAQKLMGQKATQTPTSATQNQPSNSLENQCYIAIFGYKRSDQASKVAARFRKKGLSAFYIKSADIPRLTSDLHPTLERALKRLPYTVYIGPYNSESEALKHKGYTAVRINDCKELKRLSKQ